MQWMKYWTGLSVHDTQLRMGDNSLTCIILAISVKIFYIKHAVSKNVKDIVRQLKRMLNKTVKSKTQKELKTATLLRNVLQNLTENQNSNSIIENDQRNKAFL